MVMRPAALVLAAAALVACTKAAEMLPTTSASAGTPHRIVVLTCGAVDIFTVLGELDRVVAVEEDCPAPGTDGKVKIRNDDHEGKLQAINVESILALHPDAVIAKSDLKQALDGRGLRLLWSPLYIDMDNLPGFVEEIAALIGVQAKAKDVLDRMRAKEAAIRKLTASAKPVRVYYETTGLGRTVGHGHVMDQMIRLAGGVNIAGDVEKPTFQLNGEAILAADPEVIVLGAFADPPSEVAKRPGWSKLSAVRNGRVHQIPIDRRYVTLGTPRCVEGCEEMLLPWTHPELVPPTKGR